MAREAIHPLAAGLLAACLVLGPAGTASAGSLEPPGPPGPTMKTLGEVAPSWSRRLPANDGAADGCNSTRFTCVLGDEAVLDNETGLVWERQPDATPRTWAQALGACMSRRTGGRGGWRLPAVHELRSMLEEGEFASSLAIPAGHPFVATHLLDTGLESVWSTSEEPSDRARVVVVNPLFGNLFLMSKSGDTTFMWCVRAPGSHDDGR